GGCRPCLLEPAIGGRARATACPSPLTRVVDMLERAPWLAGSGQREIGREGGQFISHADIFAFVRRYAGTIAACVLTGIGVAGAYLVTAEPIFTARSQLLIDPKMPQFLLEQRSDVNFSL